MTDPKLIKEIIAAVIIPVFAKVRIGHFGEAQILQSLGVDMIDESEGNQIFSNLHILLIMQLCIFIQKYYPNPEHHFRQPFC